jgi:tRNA(His) 5'-end guanylyltransferase
MCTAKFNQLRRDRWYTYGTLELNPEPYSEHKSQVYKRQVETLAFFDARVFVLPNEADVYSVLQWRSNDASRNSVSSVAQSLYSHKELHGKSNSDKQEMIFQKGINWNDYSYREKRGGTFTKSKIAIHKTDDEQIIRKTWQPVETPIKWWENREQFPI